MKHFILVIALFFSITLFSQMSYTDSLRVTYYSYHGDTIRYSALNLLAVYYLNNNMDSAKHYGLLLLDFARKANNKRILVRAYSYLGDLESKRNNYAMQVEYLSNSLNLMEKSKDIDGISHINMRLANAYLQMNDIENAMILAKKGIELLDKLNEKQRKTLAPRYYSTIGNIYLKQKKHTEAMPYLIKANKEAIDGEMIGWFVAKTYEDMARAYEGLNNNQLALKNYNSALSLNIHINNITGATSCREGLAGLLLKKNKLDSALINLAQSEHLAIKLNDRNALLKTYNQYISIFDQRKDYKKKSDYLALKLSLNDTINTIAFGKSLANAKVKFETGEKEKENALLSEKNKVQQLQLANSRNQIILLVVLVVAIIGIALFWLRFNKLKSKQKNTELEQKLLRSQMNPHFIFNALVSIQSFIYSNDAKAAGAFLSDFAKLMRLILENSSQEYITLTKEIDTLKYYLELQKLRNDNRFDYTIDVAEGIDIEDVLIPPMLAQPFIENSIEHGFQSLKESGKLHIRFSLRNNRLVFELVDNGKGFQTKQPVERKFGNHQSMATKITNERLNLIYDKKLKKVNFTINELRDNLNNILGTKVEFSIPFVSQY